MQKIAQKKYKVRFVNKNDCSLFAEFSSYDEAHDFYQYRDNYHADKKLQFTITQEIIIDSKQK